MNLASFIAGTWEEETMKRLPYMTASMPSRMRIAQIWDIMEDVTGGLAFIHSKGEIHRDLKPRNSMPLYVSCK